MTRDELKAILASKTNKLAGQAIEIIRRGGGASELQPLLAQGCPDTYVERDPAHPRSRYLTHKVLDTCFESKFGVITSTDNAVELGHVHASNGREDAFRFLLNAGFQPGQNSWSGGLFKHILSSCFYGEHRESAMRFAKILAEHSPSTITNFSKNDYAWTGSLEKFKRMIELGANPQGEEMINCALTYVGCSPNAGDTPEGRVEVIQELLALGATPTRNLRGCGSALFVRDALKKAGLIETLSKFGIIDIEDPAEYIHYLQHHRAA